MPARESQGIQIIKGGYNTWNIYFVMTLFSMQNGKERASSLGSSGWIVPKENIYFIKL